MLNKLYLLTKINPLHIPSQDEKVLSLFNSVSAFGIDKIPLGKTKSGKPIYETLGTLSITEFGTSFVRSLLREVTPLSFADLVQISGLSHGKNV
jgi:DNA polymerase-3 subunit alpha (Gram-positive type)